MTLGYRNDASSSDHGPGLFVGHLTSRDVCSLGLCFLKELSRTTSPGQEWILCVYVCVGCVQECAHM